MSLVALDIPNTIRGADILDESYKEYAIFPNNTWITEEAYVKEGSVIWNYGMTQEELEEMNQLVK